MNRKSYRAIGRLLFELIVIAVAMYLFLIAHNHPQEAKDALILGFMCVGADVWLEIWARLKGRVHTTLSVGLIIATAVFMSCEFCIAVGARNNMPEDMESVEYILILGNKSELSGLSGTLKARLDMAVELSKQLDVPIIVSGGNSEENSISEACRMSEYLISQGVQNDILLEDKALDTRQNFLYVAEMADTESKLIVITSEWHLFRAKMLARDMGFQYVYGIGTKTDKEMYLYFNLREVVSILREITIQKVAAMS